MRAGALRHRIVLQSKTTSTDDWGQPVETWVNVVSTGNGTIAADVRFLNGKEFIIADKEVPQETASIRIRKRTVDTAMRVLHEGKTYEITAVLPGPKRDYIDLAVNAWAGE